MKNKLYLLIILIGVFAAKAQKSSTSILITDVTVIDVKRGTVKTGQQLHIKDGKIQEIAPRISNVSAIKTTISGTGKFAIPGLAEMHAHIPSPPTSDARIKDVLFLYLSNGITTIRGMLGHPSILNLREQAKNGEILSPRIFTSSPSLNGNTIKTVEEAKIKVTQYQKEGYDFLKIHPGIQREVFDQVVQTANEVGIPFAGHVPVDVGIRHALESKYASIDHVDGFLEGLVPPSKNLNPNDNGFFGYNFTPHADSTMINELVALSHKNKVWIVPTQSLFERWFAPITADQLLKAPEMIYMPPATLSNWKKVKDEYTLSNPNFNPSQWQNFTEIRRALIKSLQEKGHGILLGSDAPQLFNVPGFSIHHEIDGMEKAGLSPLEILKAGTINPAIFFEQETVFGELKEGMAADLVLLNANPLEDMDALKQIEGVMISGKWIDKTTIAKRLSAIAQSLNTN